MRRMAICVYICVCVLVCVRVCAVNLGSVSGSSTVPCYKDYAWWSGFSSQSQRANGPIPMHFALNLFRVPQVQVIARHGSRTPYRIYNPTVGDLFAGPSFHPETYSHLLTFHLSGYSLQCWHGYGFKWDCNLTELAEPETDMDQSLVPWLYRKVSVSIFSLPHPLAWT